MSPGSSISIRYHFLFGSHGDLLLLEVDDKLLPDFLHQWVVIRGQPDEEAVLCTPSTTYAMKFVGTSNSAFLVPPGEPSSLVSNIAGGNSEMNDSVIPPDAASVLKVVPGSIELVQVAPRLDRLKSLLHGRTYSPEEEDEEMEDGAECKRGLYRWQDLVNVTPASDEELREGLRALSAVEINGYWRIINVKYMDCILKMILNNWMGDKCYDGRRSGVSVGN